ncbi:MAG: DUF4143 domain-containing protein [Anaerolineales bacterium]|nr:DUF4143 domain-containing protein [Anaerolineales bacterium]
MGDMPKPKLYIPRWMTQNLQDAIKDHPIIVLTGARQVGKSTLLSMAEPFNEWRYHTLDDFDTLRLSMDYPEDLWAGTDRIAIDEVQKMPQILSAVKVAVDRQPYAMRFALSGSANLLLMKEVSESLAGRAIYFILRPLTLGEIHRSQPPNVIEQLIQGNFPDDGLVTKEIPDPINLLLRGFMPPLITLKRHSSWVRWWDGYVSTYLERDLRQLSQIDNLPDFRRLMELTALRSGQLLNQSQLARDASLTQPTTHRYLNLMEVSYLFERLPQYTKSRSSRLIKAPKSYWTDPALAIFLSGYHNPSDLRSARELGGYFENFILHHLKVTASLMTPRGKIFCWRTRGKEEVDFVFEHGRNSLAIEVKLSTHVSYGDANNLRIFLERHPDATAGLLLYSGSKIHRLGEKIVAVPWSILTG